MHDRLRIYFEFTKNTLIAHEKLPKIIFSSNIGKIEFSNYEITRINTSNNKYFADFIIPINGIWTVHILNQNRQSYASFQYENTNLSLTEKGYTTMFCFGSEFNDRYCQINNTCFNNNKFLFFTKLNITLHTNILYPGSRPIPHDYPSCRNSIRFLRKNSTFSEFNASNLFEERSIITCRWYGMQHMWHTLFDFTIPVWWVKQKFGGHQKDDRLFVIDKNENMKKGFDFAGTLTDKEIINIKLNPVYGNGTCFKNLLLGVPKSEYVVTPEKWKNGYLLPYEFDNIAFMKYRERAIDYYNISQSLCRKTRKPRIVFVNRDTKMRNIINGKELHEEMKKWAPNIDIDYTIFNNQSMKEQIEEICNASILISIHGSALSHMLWLTRYKTAVIELFPYKYDCRDWYKQVAEGMGVKYFSWINKIPENSFQGRIGENKYFRCKEGENKCLEEGCHENLRDQPTIVDFKSFKPIFDQALDYINGLY